MGKRKPYVDPDLTFAPRINDTSRKLALRQDNNVSDGVPRFMVETVSRYISREPVFPQKQDMVLTVNGKSSSANRVSVEDELTFSPKLNETSMRMARERGQQIKVNVANKAAAVAAKLAEEHTFTFHPKVSTQSVKIAESLGSDFMSRQRQHLERQKKHMEQASITFRNIGRLSPVNRTKKRDKTSKEVDEDEDSHSNDDRDSPTSVSAPSVTLEKSGKDNEEDVITSSKSSSDVTQPEMSSSKTNLSLKRSLPRSHSPRHKRRTTYPDTTSTSYNNDMQQIDEVSESMPPHHSRSKTTLNHSQVKLNRRGSVLNLDRIKNAKLYVERAIKNHKIFTIVGKYPQIRESLRKRGWVEKFCKLPSAPKKSQKKDRKKKMNNGNSDDDDQDDDDDDDGAGTDDDDDDDVDDGNYVPPWEEDDGIYGIMSRLVRNYPPTFIWSVRRESVDHKFLSTTQIVNHYGKAGSFTTKVGLCMNMRNVPWFDSIDPDVLFPRCYRLSHDEEKQSFIDDYRLTTCINILKWVQMKHRDGLNEDDNRDDADDDNNNATIEDKENNANSTQDPNNNNNNQGVINNKGAPSLGRPQVKQKKGGTVPGDIIDKALVQCQRFIKSINHEDIDILHDTSELPDAEWDKLIQNYYKVVHEGANIENSVKKLKEAENILNKLKAHWPQFEMDGMKNVWIVKPGAKSRGRGIVCMNRLEDMLALVSSTVVKKESKYVIQKYMERPLLIYNTKFDIRQWFLVTDWNPLTLWFYKDSYLRFCSQEYTLDKFDESIHLANNAIQCNYQNGPRATQLPAENMWSHTEFQQYLSDRGAGDAWEEIIYPGMKRAITCALLTTQDVIEYRKSAFELYGADFMLTDDYHPWLIEINSSPSMSYSTKVTANLCANVLEDTMKVVLDRRYDKNCDIGQYELAFKQPQVTVPPYIGISLCIDGTCVRKPVVKESQRKTDNSLALDNTPRVSDNTPRTIQNNLSTSKNGVIQNNLYVKNSVGNANSLHRNSSTLQPKSTTLSYVGLTPQGKSTHGKKLLRTSKKTYGKIFSSSQQENVCPWSSEEDDTIDEVPGQTARKPIRKHQNGFDENEVDDVKSSERVESSRSGVSISTVEIIEKAISAGKSTSVEDESAKLQPIQRKGKISYPVLYQPAVSTVDLLSTSLPDPSGLVQLEPLIVRTVQPIKSHSKKRPQKKNLVVKEEETIKLISPNIDRLKLPKMRIPYTNVSINTSQDVAKLRYMKSARPLGSLSANHEFSVSPPEHA